MYDVEMTSARLTDSSPPAKRARRRTASAASDACGSGLQRIPSDTRPFWLPDGDIILEVGCYRYKIHRKRLSCSEIFADMLALPQPPDAERMDGVPLVRLQDNARDWMIALEWMYDPLGFFQRPHQYAYETLASALRIACKYEISPLRNWSVEHMCVIWPENVVDMTTIALPHSADFISLARAVDIPSLTRILPTAFYALTIPHSTNPTHTAHVMHTLSSTDLARFIAGSAALHSLALDLALDPLSSMLLPSGTGRISLCSTPCTSAAERVWRATLARGATGDPPGGPWGLALVRVLASVARGEVPDAVRADMDAVCQECAFQCETVAWMRVREFRKCLPKLFDL